MKLKHYVREFPDFPKPGILFKDISPILRSPKVMEYVEEQIYQYFKSKPIDLVAGAESRGLMFATALAERFGKGLIMVRKKGKLPGPTRRIAYDIEYGSAVMEIQEDAIEPGQQVLMVDDLLATGGTAKAASDLIESAGGQIVGHAFVIELAFLNGREKLKNYELQSLVTYDE